MEHNIQQNLEEICKPIVKSKEEESKKLLAIEGQNVDKLKAIKDKGDTIKDQKS